MTEAQPSHAQMRVPLDPARGELLRAFVREAALSEDVPAIVAGLLAEDAAAIWRALGGSTSRRERARAEVLQSHQEASFRLALPGHDRFAGFGTRLAGSLSPGAEIAWREHGVDGWELVVRRKLTEPLAPEAATEGGDGPSAGSGGYTIDVPQQADAPAIARCFLAVYGHAYVHPEVFSPHRYWSKVDSGDLIPVVARDERGEVVGHLALERGPGRAVAERGEAVVLPSHRGHGLLERMTDRLAEEAPRRGLQGVYAEPVTVHTYSQRNDQRAGMPFCAVLLGVNPQGYHPKGMPGAAGQRQSYLRAFRFVEPPEPRTLCAPAPYRETLHDLYATLGATVAEIPPGSGAAEASRTAIRVNGRGYGIVRFERIGASVAVELPQALRDVESLGAQSVQISAPAGDPGLPLLAEAARALGFFFCGLGPAFADGRDLFQLQRLSEPLDIGKLQLLTDQAKALVAFVESDRRAVSPPS